MLQPMFGFLFGLGFLTSMILFFGVIVLGIFGLSMLFCLRKVPLGSAGVRVGFRGFIITDTWILRIPLLTRVEMMDITVQKLVIERKGNEGLLCQDNIRADIVAAFYIKVNYPKVDYGDVEPDSPEGQRLFEQAMKSGNQSKFDDILEVAQTVGCERASDPDKLRDLFEEKFSDILKTAGKQMEFAMLYTDRMYFRENIIREIGNNLNGYALVDVAIDYLEQTPLETLDPKNVLDAEGIKKITLITSMEQEATNLRIRERDLVINDQDRKAEIEMKELDVRCEMEKRELDKQNEEHLALLTRQLDLTLAKEQKTLDDELKLTFPNIETVEEIRAHIRNNHPVFDEIESMRQEIEQLKASFTD